MSREPDVMELIWGFPAATWKTYLKVIFRLFPRHTSPYNAMSPSQLNYPPSAHTTHEQVHAAQPAPTQTMSVSRADEAQAKEQRAERIRGGCIPCPVGSSANARSSYCL